MKEYCDKVAKYGFGRVASVSGRYYAMDRDNRWERVEVAYKALVHGVGERGIDPVAVVRESYEKDITDEFILPKVIYERSGDFQSPKGEKPLALIEDDDAVIFFNFRSDRPRELTRCFIYDDFKEFPVKKINNLKYVTMTEYDVNFNTLVEVAFRNEKLNNILGQVLESNNKTQLRLAETEKYAHVTFFFNGGVEEPFKNEDRILIPSPKIASYDLQPEMSAYEVKKSALEVLANKDYDLIIINFANCDMVGHTGKFEAVIKAVETVDKCLSEIVPVAKEKGYHVIVTADHGNAEQMLDEAGNTMTAHSMNEVPLILIYNGGASVKLSNGKLGDIAQTILHLMNIQVPKEMTGRDLVLSK